MRRGCYLNHNLMVTARASDKHVYELRGCAGVDATGVERFLDLRVLRHNSGYRFISNQGIRQTESRCIYHWNGLLGRWNSHYVPSCLLEDVWYQRHLDWTNCFMHFYYSSLSNHSNEDQLAADYKRKPGSSKIRKD